MLETKIKLSRRQLFARKGEAMPTMAVEAGIKPHRTTGPFAGLSSAVNSNDLRSAEKLVQASTLSSLITRRIPRAPVTAPEAFYAERPIARPALRPAPVFTKDSAVPERPEAVPGPSKAKTLVGVDYGVKGLNEAVEPVQHGLLEALGMGAVRVAAA